MQQGLSWETIASEIGKNFSLFYETWRFCTVFARARRLSLSCSRWIQSILSILFFRIHFNIILPSTSRFSMLFHSFSFPQQTLYVLLLSSIRVTCLFHFIHFYSKIRIIFSKKYKLWCSLLCSFFFNHLLLLLSKATISCWAPYS